MYAYRMIHRTRLSINAEVTICMKTFSIYSYRLELSKAQFICDIFYILYDIYIGLIKQNINSMYFFPPKIFTFYGKNNYNFQSVSIYTYKCMNALFIVQPI